MQSEPLGTIILVIFVLDYCIYTAQGTQHRGNIASIPKPPSISNISAQEVLEHVQHLLELSEMKLNYDSSRVKSIDYIVNVLTSSSGKGMPFSGDQVQYHKFDWTDTTVEKRSSIEESVVTTWSGVNILVWTNTSQLQEGSKFSVVGARYDSQGWWSENHGSTYPCSTSKTYGSTSKICSRKIPQSNQSGRIRTVTTALELMGACILLQLARAVLSYQRELKETLELKSPLELLYHWNKSDPSTIETGIYEDIPILFVFFDQEAVGNLGSQVWSEYYNIGKLYEEGNIVSLSSIDILDLWKPYEPIPGRNCWKGQSPYFSLSSSWLSQLLSPPVEEFKRIQNNDEL